MIIKISESQLRTISSILRENYTMNENIFRSLSKVISKPTTSTLSKTIKKGNPKIVKAGKDISYLKDQIKKFKNEESILMKKFIEKNISKEQYISDIKKLHSKYNFTKINDALFNRRYLLNVEKNKSIVGNLPQENILKNKYQLGRNISHGGSHNLGVFDLGNGYVAKASPSGWRDQGIQNLKWKDKIKSPRVMKTVQVKSFVDSEGKEIVYQVQQKATGIGMDKMTADQIKKIPQKHKLNFENDVRELENAKISIDPSKRSNFVYDPNKGIQFIDLGGVTNIRSNTDDVINAILNPFK